VSKITEEKQAKESTVEKETYCEKEEAFVKSRSILQRWGGSEMREEFDCPGCCCPLG
jgi:hypothetical protein